MANVIDKVSKNVAGPFFVDSSCIDCDLCREIAPTVFRRDEESGCSYVYRQPQSAAEIELAEEARTSCPVEAIGRDVS